MRSSTPPCPGMSRRAVLHLRGALEHGLEQIADDAHGHDREAEQKTPGGRHVWQPDRADQRHDQRADQ